MAVNYYNTNGDQLAVVHFPGNGLELGYQVVADNIDRDISVSDNLTIISIMNKKCWDNSYIVKQADNNGFIIINTALDEQEWNNTLKINHILRCIDIINTDYTLILDGRDTIITANLDDVFLARFKEYNKPILFNATPFSYPNVVIEPLNELIRIQGKAKYLNAGVCIGKTNTLKTFYTKALDIKNSNPANKSEQLIIRKTRQSMLNTIGIDSNNRLFRIVHQTDSRIDKIDKGKMIV